MFYSCRQAGETPSPADFAPYIAACTGGMIADGSTVVVELAAPQPDDVWTKAIDRKLFAFSPSLKGRAQWLNSRTVEFVPEEGQLRDGTTYRARFALGKVIGVEKKFAQFDFSFRVEDCTFEISTEPVILQPDHTATVRGTLTFSKAMNPGEARRLLTADLDGRPAEVTVEGRDNARAFPFFVSGITRTNETRRLLLHVCGDKAKTGRRETHVAVIPPEGRFRLLDCRLTNAPEYGLQLVFSDPVSDSQDLKSMISLRNIPDYLLQVQANRVTVYFTPPEGMNELGVTVHPELKNREGAALGDISEFALSFEKLKPQVEILSDGVIMPRSERLILPFRTVGLYAADLKIVRIFENNILMFLQDNLPDGNASYQLRRAGRIAYRQTIRLDADPAKDVAQWEHYSLDLTKFIRQQPGAIYRIELSFRREYAAYGCEDAAGRERMLAGAVDIASISGEAPALGETEEAYWDSPDAYHYDGYDLDVDWMLYDWKERDNPCHPTYYMIADRKAITSVLASDLGMIAKSNASNKVWAAVTNLLDTRPVEAAQVTAYNFQLQPIAAGTTDGNGFVVLTPKNRPFLLVASAGEQKAYLRMSDGRENLLSRFDVGGTEAVKGLKGYIYGERGIWRPGDTLHIAFMLEDRGRTMPENHPVTFELYTPQGQFYKKITSSGGAGGLYAFDVSTKADDPTGLWSAVVKVGGASFHKSLRIETVRPNRLKIRLDLPEIIDALKGSIPAAVHAQWLTGATANSLPVKMELLLAKTSTPFKGYERYTFNNPGSTFSSDKTEVFGGRLDESGNARLNIKPPAAANAPGMLRAAVACRVFEPGGDASIFTQTALFSPYASYVGIDFNMEKKEDCLFTDEDHFFELATLSADGLPLSRDLEYKIYRVGWSWWWENENESFDAYVNNTSYKPLFAGKIKTVNGKGQLKFRINYPDWGRYLVLVKDVESGHVTGGAVPVDWPSWRGRSGKNDPSGIKMLSFALDKASYNVGEEAVATIPATAAGGRALVALENGSEVIRREWIDLAAGRDTKYTFQVTGYMSPNIYLHISLLQPHAATADLPIRMYGVVPVFVTDKASALAPVIVMPDELKPETDFKVRVKEKDGKPMRYTLAIVDEGLLDLTNFKTPDPWQEFYAREALGVRTWDLFDQVIGAYAGKYGSLFSVGGDGELNHASAKANRFKPVVICLAPQQLKAGEEKTHVLRLPASYVGSVRVMVVAGENGAYGKADRQVAVRTPLMLLASLPRVLSAGEAIALPVNVFAMDNTVKQVAVKVETTGKLTATEGNSRSLTFAASGDKLVYFPMKTGTATGRETITVTATGGGHTSRETIEIDVRNPNPPALRYEARLLEKGQSAEFDCAPDETGGDSRAMVEMSRIPAPDLSRRFDFLADYRHYCTEQLTSRALPLLYLPALKTLDKEEAEAVKTQLTEAIAHLYRRQLPDGAFACWPDGASADDWVSSYAGLFLTLAREKGYHVNGGVTGKWISYQRGIARKWRAGSDAGSRYTYRQGDFLQAFRLYTLALADAPEMSAMNRLREVKDLSLQARWRLAAAYALCGKKEAANELVRQAETTVAPYSPDNPTYGSSLRDEAMILETLVLLDRPEEAFRQAQKVSGHLSGETYFATQSTAYAMAALGELAGKTSGRLDFEWSLNDTPQPRADAAKAVFRQQLPADRPTGKVKVTNGNGGLLYVGLSTKTRPLIDSLPAASENIRIAVSYTGLDGAPVATAKMKQGTDFYAVVKVSNISVGHNYPDVALTHFIPSGWEIYNERIASDGADASGVFMYQDIRDDCVLTYFDLPAGMSKTVKVRLRAAYAGEFVFPAILCEAMYDASARARTTAGRVIVSED